MQFVTKDLLKIALPRYCACCWRPVTAKNKKGRPENYCALHKPEGETKRDYMKAQRQIKKALAAELDSIESLKVNSEYTAKLNELVSALIADPKSLSFAEVDSGKGLIKELLSITSMHYENAFKPLQQLGDYTEQANLPIKSVLLAIHFALGTIIRSQAESEISVYETKKTSTVWFVQLLFTIARYEAFTVIAERAQIRRIRSDKNLTLRLSIKKEVDLAINSKNKLNQTSIAKKLNLSKQRVGKLIKELYQTK